MAMEHAWPSETADPFTITATQAAHLLGHSPWRRLTALGDSVVHGVTEPVDGFVDQPCVDRVAACLSRGTAAADSFGYLNLGRRRAFAAQVLAHQIDAAVAFEPDLAIVAAGGTDTLGSGFDPDAVRDVLAAIVGRLRVAGADVVTLGRFDISQSSFVPAASRAALRERLHALSRITTQVADEYGALHVDLTSHAASRENTIYSSDGINLTARGHAIAATETIRRLARHLGRTG